MRAVSRALGALAAVALLIALLYLAVISFAFRVDSYADAPPYDAMAEAVTAYLSGEADALPESLFNEQERLHMADVRALFDGGRRLATGCLIVCAALCALSLLAGGRHGLSQGLLLGLAAFALAAGAIAVWAAVDFSGWFEQMHRLVFTNDLWLFDPAESALINMMPLDFFIDAVRTIALRFALGAALLVLAALALVRPRKAGVR